MDDYSKKLLSIIDKCDLVLNDTVISRELICRVFTKYLIDMEKKSQHNYGLVLHTGSIVFDAISVAFATILNLLNNSSTTDSVLDSLSPGDSVIYGKKTKQRYVYEGYSVMPHDPSIKCIVLKQGKNTTSVPESMWRYIIPYFGSSSRMDGRGLRRGTGVREEFCRDVLEMQDDEIPSIINSSTVLVLPKERIDQIVHDLRFLYGARVFKLLDIVTASYFTETDELQYGGNIGKTEPVLKFCSRVSIGRQLLLDKSGNSNIGIIISGNDIIGRSLTELPELIHRKSIRYILILSHIDSEHGPFLLNEDEDVQLLACTKDFLLSNTKPVQIQGSITNELENQVNAVIDRHLEPISLPGPLTWEDFSQFKKSILRIKQSGYQTEAKDDFIIQSCALMNLFLTAPFPLNTMSNEIESGRVSSILSPSERLDALKSFVIAFSPDEKENAEIIIRIVSDVYSKLWETSGKFDKLFDLIRDNHNSRIAVIVPKAYYVKILEDLNLRDFVDYDNRLKITTANRFDNSKVYDLIVTLGDYSGSRYDSFRCRSANHIVALLYDFEANLFKLKLKKAEQAEKEYDKKSAIEYETDIELTGIEYSDGLSETDVEKVSLFDSDINSFLNSIGQSMGLKHFVAENAGSGSTTEAVAFAQFETGESAMFTKMYKAYVLDEDTGDVKEASIDELMEGDSLIFTKNNEYTRDIVDYILSGWIDSGNASAELSDAYKKSKYWKEALIDYMHITELTPGSIAKIMIKNGVQVQESTIKTWLDAYSHTVGPRKKESLEQIALLINDNEMLDNVDVYFDACRAVRSLRREILKSIGNAIIKNISGNEQTEDVLVKLIAEKIDSISMVLKLESITSCSQEVPINAVNRPFLLKE